MSFCYTEENNSGKILEELKQIKEMLQDLLEMKRNEKSNT